MFYLKFWPSGPEVSFKYPRVSRGLLVPGASWYLGGSWYLGASGAWGPPGARGFMVPGSPGAGGLLVPGAYWVIQIRGLMFIVYKPWECFFTARGCYFTSLGNVFLKALGITGFVFFLKPQVFYSHVTPLTPL